MDYSKFPYWKNQTPPKRGVKYTDDLFPPNENSLIGKDSNGNYIDPVEGEKSAKRIKTNSLVWKRCSDIFKNKKYLLFEEKIEMADINQGSLGDCYFLASVAALTDYPNLIYKIFITKEINKEGYFEVLLFIDGQFQRVILDDYLPVNKTTNLIDFARPNKNEIWVCLLEKAWAKVNGGYSNVIKGWMHQVLQTLTGFASSSYNHTGMNPENLWRKIAFAHSKECIIACSSRKDVESKGLVNSHAYTLVDLMNIKSKGKRVQLVKMRNTWGFKEWNGDWGDRSPLWGEEEKEQVKYQKRDDGVFFMSYEDFFNYFMVTDICYVLYDSYSKTLKVDAENMRQAQIFNVCIEEESILSANIIKKMWRFNRILKGKLEPATINIMEYDPNSSDSENMLKNLDGRNHSTEDVSITELVQPGFYMIYTYIDVAHSTTNNNEGYFVKFDCTSKFKVRHSGMDLIENDLPILRKMHIQHIKNKSEKYKPGEKFQSFIANIGKSGISHRILFNPSRDKWLKYQEDVSGMSNNFILSPYGKNGEFDWYIPPYSFNAILGMELNSNEKSKFALKAKAFNVKNHRNNNEDLSVFNLQDVCNNLVIYEDNSDINSYYDYITIPLEKAKEMLLFEKIDMSALTIDEIKSKEATRMKLITRLLKPVDNDKDLSWVIQKNKSGKYIGQINKNRKKEGRGLLEINDTNIVGYFEADLGNGKAVVYDKGFKNKLFEGNYVDGKREGYGVIYYNNGDRYEGNFSNNVKNGEGTYYYKSGTSWTGHFDDDKMNGEGIFAKGDKTKKVTFINGVMQK